MLRLDSSLLSYGIVNTPIYFECIVLYCKFIIIIFKCHLMESIIQAVSIVNLGDLKYNRKLLNQ